MRKSVKAKTPAKRKMYGELMGEKPLKRAPRKPLRAQHALPPSVSPIALFNDLADSLPLSMAIEEGPPTSTSIVRTKADETTAITMMEYGGLQDAFNFLNTKLFGGKLPDAFFNYTRKPRMLGHFSEDRYSARDGKFKKPEIALNPDSFIGRTDEQIVSTLAHEMTHLQQHCFGKPSSRGYHNREWAASMKAIGLMPSNTGAIGGRETGQQMDHYILPGGAFAQAFAELAATGWKLNLQSTIYAGGTRKPDDSKTKFTCPACDWIIRGKPDTKMICKPCLVVQLSGMDRIDPNMAEELLTAIGRAEMVSEHAVTDADASYDQQAAE